MFKACIDLKELVDCFLGSVKCGTLVFGFEGRRVLFNFHFDNYVRRGSFRAAYFSGPCFEDQCQKGDLIMNRGELGMAHPVG